jgi:hypothetical protein
MPRADGRSMTFGESIKVGLMFVMMGVLAIIGCILIVAVVFGFLIAAFAVVLLLVSFL